MEDQERLVGRKHRRRNSTLNYDDNDLVLALADYEDAPVEEKLYIAFDLKFSNSVIKEYFRLSNGTMARKRARYEKGTDFLETPGVMKLEPSEEDAIVACILERSEENLVTTLHQFYELCRMHSSARDPHGNIVFSPRFHRYFFQRHNDRIKLSFQTTVSHVYLRAAHPDNLLKFLQALNDRIMERPYNPALIWNFDETMLSFDEKHQKLLTIVPVEADDPIFTSYDISGHYTLGLSVSLNGLHAKSLLVYPFDTKQEEFHRPFQPWLAVKNKSGWINSSILVQYISEVFIPKIAEVRKEIGDEHEPVLLIMDGHPSRRDPRLHQILRNFGIDLFILPANVTSFLQPLDASVNGAFKQNLHRKFRSFPFTEEGNKAAQLREFLASELPVCLYRAHDIDIIHSGWKKTKLTEFPITRERLLEIPFVKKASEKEFKEIFPRMNAINGRFLN